MKCVFGILNRLGVAHKCDRRTDGQTDRHSYSKCRAHYVAQPKWPSFCPILSYR